mmetsp:Transcript_40044/g.127423  ORF Transcript_40044/g.127423 Transcript_40044/m.127423 type:complete len:327 (-) Transcript_40044:164-1144(-)
MTNPGNWRLDAPVGFDRKISEVTTSDVLFAEAEQTLIFFDWDDTLFPTTAIFEEWGVDAKMENVTGLPEGLEEELRAWRAAVQRLLTSACSCSARCVIMTNSKRPWVHDCVRRFAPDLLPLLEGHLGPSVVYAREALVTGRREGLRPVRNEFFTSEDMEQMLTKAKQLSMAQVAEDFYSRYPGQTWKNILSVGDMLYEHSAVQEVTFSRRSPPREHVRTKAITVPTQPSLGVLTCRLQLCDRLLPAFVSKDGDLSLDLEVCPEPMDALAEALEMPQLADLAALRYAWGRAPWPGREEVARALRELGHIVEGRVSKDRCPSTTAYAG